MSNVSLNVPSPPQVAHELTVLYLEKTFNFNKDSLAAFLDKYDEVYKTVSKKREDANKSTN